jgi:hypothetical protein
MTEDEFQPNAHEPPARIEPSQGQTQTAPASQEMSEWQASAPNSPPQPEHRAAAGRTPLFRV